VAAKEGNVDAVARATTEAEVAAAAALASAAAVTAVVAPRADETAPARGTAHTGSLVSPEMEPHKFDTRSLPHETISNTRTCQPTSHRIHANVMPPHMTPTPPEARTMKWKIRTEKRCASEIGKATTSDHKRGHRDASVRHLHPGTALDPTPPLQLPTGVEGVKTTSAPGELPPECCSQCGTTMRKLWGCGCPRGFDASTCESDGRRTLRDIWNAHPSIGPEKDVRGDRAGETSNQQDSAKIMSRGIQKLMVTSIGHDISAHPMAGNAASADRIAYGCLYWSARTAWTGTRYGLGMIVLIVCTAVASMGVLCAVHKIYRTTTRRGRNMWRMIPQTSNAFLLMIVLWGPLALVIAIWPLDTGISLVVHTVGLVWVVRHLTKQIITCAVPAATDLALACAIRIAEATNWASQHPSEIRQMMVSAAALAMLCLQLATAAPTAPILATNIPAIDKGLKSIPELREHARWLINICLIAGLTIPQTTLFGAVMTLIVTPITIASWNGDFAPEITRRPGETESTHYAGPQEETTQTERPHTNTRAWLLTGSGTPPKQVTWPITTTPHTSDDTLYHEQQQKELCMIHAINNLLGGPYIDPQHVLQYCRTMLQHMVDRDLHNAAATWRLTHNQNTGNFSTLAINPYLRYNVPVRTARQRNDSAHPHVASIGSGHEIKPNVTLSSVLHQLPEHARNWGFIVHLTGHAIAVRKHKDRWYIHDSLQPQPVELGDENATWPRETGAVYTLNLWRHNEPTATHVDLRDITPPDTWIRTAHTENTEIQTTNNGTTCATARPPQGQKRRKLKHPRAVQLARQTGRTLTEPAGTRIRPQPNADDNDHPPAPNQIAAPLPSPLEGAPRERPRQERHPGHTEDTLPQPHDTTTGAPRTTGTRVRSKPPHTQSTDAQCNRPKPLTIMDHLRRWGNKRTKAAGADHPEETTHTTKENGNVSEPSAQRPRLSNTPVKDNTSPHPENANHSDHRNETDHRYLHIVTHNVRGLATNFLSTLCNVRTWVADIIVLTETKTGNRTGWMKDALRKEPQGYRLYCSSKPRSSGKERCSAGVAIAIGARYTRAGQVMHIPPPPLLHGHLCHCKISTSASTPLHVLGIYCPEDTLARTTIYVHCQTVLKQAKSNGEHVVLAGDFNAVLNPDDRSTGLLDTADRLHLKFITDNKLIPVPENCSPRHPSFKQWVKECCAHQSRIDDILMCPALHASAKAETPATGNAPEAYCSVSVVGGNFDHNPVHARLPADAIRLWDAKKPATPKNPDGDGARTKWKNVILPVPNTTIRAAQSKMDASLTSDILSLQEYLRPAVHEIEVGLAKHTEDPTDMTATRLMTLLRDHDSITAVNVEIAAAMLQTTLDKGLDILLDMCPQKPPCTGKIHTKRTVSRGLKKLHTEHTRLKHDYEKELRMQAAPGCQQPDCVDSSANPSEPALNCAHATPEGTGDFLSQLRDTIRWVGTQIRQALTIERRKSITAARRRTQHLIATRPRRAHQGIFSKDELERGLPAVRHPVSGKVCTEPESILEAVHQYYQTQAAPIGAPKTGRYRPEEIPRSYPFLQSTAPDAFSLTSPRQATDHVLLSSVADPFNFNKSIQHLARNKTPGPDGLPNELLRALPAALQSTIHDLLKVMWVQAHTPKTWTESVTVLLPKAGDALLLSNKRPIALANTLYKLWTSLVTVSIGDVAPELTLFSEAQEGFLRYRNTERQIQNLLHVIEDAGLTRKDLYLLYVDFSSAFNTINHDLLLQIMYDLGLPEDLICVVRDLYSQARTTIRTEHGLTAPIMIERGTVQGDTLSPVLFIIFLEPLLRWLHVGGRGYKYGCLSDSLNARYHGSSAAYADDLAVMTNSTHDLQIQCDKISLYSAWAGLHANHKKCAVTGILHHRAWADRGLNGPTCARTLKSALAEKIKISGQAVPYLPPTDPYKYLGVHVTLTLNWSAQMTHVCKAVRDKGDLLQGSLASSDQCIRIIQNCIQPIVSYSFPTMAYTPNDIRLLDAMIARVARRCYGLPTSFPTRAVLLPAEQYGLGVGSLLPIYVRMAARALALSLNDEGRLGVVTRAMLKLQCRLAADTRMHALKRESSFYTTLKQLTLARDHGITVTDKGTPYNTSLNTLMTAASAVNARQDTKPETLPYRCLLPLTELGLDMHALIDKNTTQHLITTTELQKLFPRGKVQHRHKVALNRLSLAISAQCPQAPHTKAHDPRCWSSALPLEDRRFREIPSDPPYTGLRHKASLPNPVLAPSLDPHVHRDTPVAWRMTTQKPRQPREEPDDMESDPPAPPSHPTEPACTRRKRTRSVYQRQQDFINNNTRCDNSKVGTDNATIHGVHLRDPTPQRTSYMEARRVMAALRQDTRRSVPNLGNPPGPIVQGPRPCPSRRTCCELSIDMTPGPGKTGSPNPVLAYLAEKGLECTPATTRTARAGAGVGAARADPTTIDRDHTGDPPAPGAAGALPGMPKPLQHLTPQWWRPRWKVARDQILED